MESSEIAVQRAQEFVPATKTTGRDSRGQVYVHPSPGAQEWKPDSGKHSPHPMRPGGELEKEDGSWVIRKIRKR